MHRRILTFGLAVVLVAGLVPACNCSDPPPSSTTPTNPGPTPTPGAQGEWDFALSGTEFTDHEGELVVVRIINASNVVACDASAVVSGGAFSITIPKALITDWDYTVEFFANMDGNAMYNSGVDRTYSLDVAGVTDHVAESYDATTGQGGIAWPINTSCPTP